ncbi:bifunctional 3,4-dihydroxy-2-butanone-4-phosphate synthase/GTP cyclohydrolase II [Streptomyces sp. NPDC093595]|uniref:bifunctional 3,4-dihydroxy-2-butanone-4-phosphate synthase/GTP cyclohydrolase II n=1 Tax=Streptomyces sp. NPDC093595 TaxID=3366045 RepID=UPI003812BEE6
MAQSRGVDGRVAVLDSVEHGIGEVSAGRPIVIVDDEDRENEGDLMIAACHATPESFGMMVRYGSGVVCVGMLGADLDRLALPPMTAVNEDPKGTAYAVSVDAAWGVTTGISAADRALTARVLADPGSRRGDLHRPGHVFPLRAVPGGVLRRPGHTEASVDLAQLAGLPPAGVICELVNDDGSVMRLPQLMAFARERGLAIISIADLVRYRRRFETHVERAAETRLPTRHGVFRAVGYRSTIDGSYVEGVALAMGEIGDGEDVLVRVHSECLTGDVFGSQRCDCGAQLDAALQRIATVGRGVVLYMRGHEGRGIGLLHKLQAYQLQDGGQDTVEANLALGLPADARDYGTGAQILADLGVRSMRLLTNNPDKRAALEGFGLRISSREPLEVLATADSLRYLRTKRDRCGHDLTSLEPTDVPTEGLTAEGVTTP